MNFKHTKFIYMKKIIAFVFMFCLMLLSSCASKGGETFNETYIDGVAYEYYEDVFLNNEIYTLYKPTVINHPEDGLPEYLQAVQYSYQELKYEGVDNWRIDYFYQFDVLLSNTDLDEEVVNVIVDKIKLTFSQYQQKLDITFEEYDFYNPTHIELISKDAKATSTYLTVLYLPFYLVNNLTNQNYMIHIPVKTFFAYRYDDVVIFDYLTKEISISYNTFISLSNITNIIERGHKYV